MRLDYDSHRKQFFLMDGNFCHAMLPWEDVRNEIGQAGVTKIVYAQIETKVRTKHEQAQMRKTDD